MTEEEQREVISSLGIDQIFEGVGNIINIVGNIVGGSNNNEAKETQK